MDNFVVTDVGGHLKQTRVTNTQWDKILLKKCNFGSDTLLVHTVQNFKKIIIICSLFFLCSPGLILTRSPQISGQNKSEAREVEGLVKITYGIVASSLFKRAGNSN